MVRYPFLCALASNDTLAKKIFLGSGLYSAVFAKYCKCRLTDSRPTTILFYALLILYILCTATIVADMVALILEVSNNSICKNILSLSVVQSRYRTLPLQKQLDSHLMIYRLFITQSIASGCSDFLAQCILVRINHCIYHPFYSFKSLDISLLDCVGSKYLCRDSSFFHGNRARRSVDLSSFYLIIRFQFIASSYLVYVRRRIYI